MQTPNIERARAVGQILSPMVLSVIREILTPLISKDKHQKRKEKKD